MLMVCQFLLIFTQMATLSHTDMESAYLPVPIHHWSSMFLVVQVDQHTLQFTVIPCGLSLALVVFTKLRKVVAKLLFWQGIEMLMYIDDWVVQTSLCAICDGYCDRLANVSLSQVPGKPAKASLNPTQSVVWLGMEWYS